MSQPTEAPKAGVSETKPTTNYSSEWNLGYAQGRDDERERVKKAAYSMPVYAFTSDKWMQELMRRIEEPA